MNVSSVGLTLTGAASLPEAISGPQTAEQASQRAQLVQAVTAVNNSKALGENNELTFVMDRNTHKMVTRVIDKNTQAVVMQIPPEYVIQLGDQINGKSSP